MTEFEGVVPALGKALAKRGYETLTPVQQAVITAEMRDADALVSAQTGSGKTVAFGLAMASTLLGDAERFERVSSPIALAVAPTRELALQVKRELEWLYEFTGASVVSCVGGMDMRAERMALQRGAHIVVGTPGRLRDHVERRSLDMSDMKVIVLDEADEMLDLGFREDLEFILKAAPESRRTLMFSATVPRTIASLAKRYQKDAVRISTAGEKNQHVDIEYRALACAPNDRENAIINVLRHSDAVTTLVFCSTRATVNHLTNRFNNRGISVVALSGELSQSARTQALQALRDGRAQVCVATDVAARGIDLPNLELVIHADLPKNQESLLHRSGRTGRAGRKGVSTLIVPYSKRRQTERMLSNANIKATWGKPPSAEEILALDRQRILEDADLGGENTEEERAFAAELLSRHDAEAIAIAFLRKRMAGLAAPEELMNDPSGSERYERSDRGDRGGRGDRGDRGPRDESRKRRQDFENGVWIRLSVGRNHKAEARWLLPMLCRTGDITKTDVGAIKIQETETHVELHPNAVDKFLAAVGPSRKVEKSITVDRMASAPSEASPASEPRAPRAPRKPRADGEPASRAPRAPRPPRGEAEQGGYPPKRQRDMGEVQARDAVTQSVDTTPSPTPEPSSKADAGTAPDRKPKKPRKPKDGDVKAGAKFGKPKLGKPKLGKPKFDKPKSASASADGKPGKTGKPAKGKPQPKPGSGPKKPHRKGVNKPKAPWVD